jgi:hypothetical protein
VGIVPPLAATHTHTHTVLPGEPSIGVRDIQMFSMHLLLLLLLLLLNFRAETNDFWKSLGSHSNVQHAKKSPPPPPPSRWQTCPLSCGLDAQLPLRGCIWSRFGSVRLFIHLEMMIFNCSEKHDKTNRFKVTLITRKLRQGIDHVPIMSRSCQP